MTTLDRLRAVLDAPDNLPADASVHTKCEAIVCRRLMIEAVLPQLMAVAVGADEIEEDCVCALHLANTRAGECGTCSAVRELRETIESYLA